MTNSITEIEVIDWELTDYAEAFDQQKSRVEQRRTGKCGDALIFTEHTPVYTMGMRKDSEQHLLWTEAECSRQGIAVLKSNRGGDITYHGPGQIVGYPILSLAHRKALALVNGAVVQRPQRQHVHLRAGHSRCRAPRPPHAHLGRTDRPAARHDDERCHRW